MARVTAVTSPREERNDVGDARADVAKPLKEDERVPCSVVSTHEGDNRRVAHVRSRGHICSGIAAHSG